MSDLAVIRRDPAARTAAGVEIPADLLVLLEPEESRP